MKLNLDIEARKLQIGDIFRSYSSATIGHPITTLLMTMNFSQISVQVNGMWIIFSPNTKVAIIREVDEYVPEDSNITDCCHGNSIHSNSDKCTDG